MPALSHEHPHEHPHVWVSPMLPVTDLSRALRHYAELGFDVAPYDTGYGFASCSVSGRR